MKVTLLVVTLVGLNVINIVAGFAKLDEVFSWKDVSFAWPSEEAKNNAIANGDYVVENNLPLGLARWKNKLFVTLPRWKAGIPSTLNYVLLNGTDQSPALIPYPNWESNQLPKEKDSAKETTIVSVFRIHVDVCDRLWVLDTGLIDIFFGGKRVISPTITVWNLNTDELLHKYTLKPEDVTTESFFANIVVDVTKDKCDQAFAYVPDLGGYGLVVYSLAANDSWRIRHNYFHFDPLKGDLLIGGINFQWSDGIFGIALGPVESDGYRTAYFHPMLSESEFSVNTRVWQNKTLALDRASYHLYKVEGNKGNNSQSTASSYDENTNVIFFAQLQKDGVGCWNSKKEMKPENVDLVAQDHEKLLFPNDIKLDEERNLWILSDKLPFYFYSKLDHNVINYRIMKVPVDEAIKGTVCAP